MLLCASGCKIKTHCIPDEPVQSAQGALLLHAMLGTILFLLAPPALVALLLCRFPEARTFRWSRLALYVVSLAAMITAALVFVAGIAGGRIIYSEILVVLWFTFGWRAAWELWRRSVGRLGARRTAAPGTGRLVRWGIPAGRAALTGGIFFTLFLSTVLTHRVKIADGTDPQMAFGRSFEPVRIPTVDGLTLDGWFVPERGADRTILICHGAGANKGNFIWFMGPLTGRGYNVLLFDFRAHGASQGRQTTYGIRERRDVRAAVDWLKEHRPEASRVLVGLGSSQGAMALAQAAAEDERIDAIVLDSPFVSPWELASHHAGRVPVLGRAIAGLILGEMSLLTGTNFFAASAEQALARGGDRPILIIHGNQDAVMPAEHAQRLHDAVPGPRAIWWGPGAHSNIVTANPEAYAQRLFSFLDAHLGQAGPPISRNKERDGGDR